MDMIESHIVSAAMGVSSAYLGRLARRKFSSVLGSRKERRLKSRSVRIDLVDSHFSWNRSKHAFLTSVSASKVIVMDFQWFVDSSDEPTVVSLSMATSKHELAIVRLFEFSQIPEDLEEIFRDPTILKLGVGIVEGAAALDRDLGIDIQGCIDIRYLAMTTPALKQKLLRTRSDLSLESLMDAALGMHPAAKEDEQASDWTVNELSGAHYAYLAERASGAFDLTRHICAANGVIPRVISVLRSELWLEHFISHEFSQFADVPFQLERVTRAPLPVKKTVPVRPRRICAVCEAEDSSILVHVIPQEYHDAFPEPLDDIVSLCYPCNYKFQYSANLLRRELETLYDAPLINPDKPFVEDEFLMRISRAGILLRDQRDSLPEDHREELEGLLMRYFFTDRVDDEIILRASSIDYRQPLVDLEYHGALVCRNLSQDELKPFEKLWRNLLLL